MLSSLLFSTESVVGTRTNARKTAYSNYENIDQETESQKYLLVSWAKELKDVSNEKIKKHYGAYFGKNNNPPELSGKLTKRERKDMERNYRFHKHLADSMIIKRNEHNKASTIST